jgi:hypothetical protein
VLPDVIRRLRSKPCQASIASEGVVSHANVLFTFALASWPRCGFR